MFTRIDHKCNFQFQFELIVEMTLRANIVHVCMCTISMYPEVHRGERVEQLVTVLGLEVLDHGITVLTRNSIGISNCIKHTHVILPTLLVSFGPYWQVHQAVPTA